MSENLVMNKFKRTCTRIAHIYRKNHNNKKSTEMEIHIGENIKVNK